MCSSTRTGKYILFFYLGPDVPLFFQTLETFAKALALGTIKNRDAQAKLYLKFMLRYEFNYLNPSITALAMYSQFWANTYPSPATAKNHFSGVRSWVTLHGGTLVPSNPMNFISCQKL